MSDEIYTDPTTGILRNLQNAKTPAALIHAEIMFTGMRELELVNNPVQGNFDFNHLKAIHAHLFQDIYKWAGEPRTVNIGKGNLFCLVEHIDSYATEVFSRFKSDCENADNADAFARTLAEHYADLNALHPFREGNGRTQREFARELCAHCGYPFDLRRETQATMLEASKASFNGDNSKLEKIFRQAIEPYNETYAPHAFAILAHDDLDTESDNKTAPTLHNAYPESIPAAIEEALYKAADAAASVGACADTVAARDTYVERLVFNTDVATVNANEFVKGVLETEDVSNIRDLEDGIPLYNEDELDVSDGYGLG